MPRRVASVVRSAPVGLRGADPALEANVYAIAEQVDLTVVLLGPAVELALAGERALGGDLVVLLESGVPVYASEPDMERLGLGRGDLVEGVKVVDAAAVAAVLHEAEAILVW